MSIDAAMTLLEANLTLIVFSGLGGLVLCGFNVVEHFKRATGDKMGLARYSIYFIALLIFLPALGVIFASMYIINGDKMGAALAFQVGLTSPAIAQGMMIAVANKGANDPIPVTDPDQ